MNPSLSERLGKEQTNCGNVQQRHSTVVAGACAASPLNNQLLRLRFAAALLPQLFWINIPSHSTRVPPMGLNPWVYINRLMKTILFYDAI